MSTFVVAVADERLKELGSRAVALGASPNDVNLVAARAVAGFVRNYLYDLDESHPNKMGGRRTHFFAKAADSVTRPKAVSGGAMFAIMATGFALLYYGGSVLPGKNISSATGLPTRLLAIAALPETYGFTPLQASSVQDMAFVPNAGGGGRLVQAQRVLAKKGPNKGREYLRAIPGGAVLYWLVLAANIPEHKNFLPGVLAMRGAAVDAVSGWITSFLEKGGAHE